MDEEGRDITTKERITIYSYSNFRKAEQVCWRFVA